MSGSMGDPPTKKSIGCNYIDVHNNLVSAVWNQGPGGCYMSQQANGPSASFPLPPPIGIGGYRSFGQLLQHASAGALHQHLNCDGYWTNSCTNHESSAEQVEGYEAGEDSGSETETGDENGSEDDPFPSACNGGFVNDDFVATVCDDTPLKKFQNRCYGSDYDDDRRGSDDTAFFEDEVQVLELGKDDFTTMVDAEVGSAGVDGDMDEFHGSAGVDHDKDQFDGSPSGSDDTADFQSGEAIASVEGTDLTSEGGSPCLLGDCGCAGHEIAQEISSTYTESQKAGYKKR